MRLILFISIVLLFIKYECKFRHKLHHVRHHLSHFRVNRKAQFENDQNNENNANGDKQDENINQENWSDPNQIPSNDGNDLPQETQDLTTTDVPSNSIINNTQTTSSADKPDDEVGLGAAWVKHVQVQLNLHEKECQDDIEKQNSSQQGMKNERVDVQPDPQMHRLRFSIGESAIIASQFSVMFGPEYNKEILAAYENFRQQDDLLNLNLLEKGMKANNWKLDGASNYLELAKRYMSLYSQNGSQLMGDEEFAYMVAKEVGAYPLTAKCQNCMEETRTSIEDFFNYVDCDKDSFINSQELQKQLHTITKNQFSSFSTNDFILKAQSDDVRDGHLDPIEFVTAALRSLYETEVLEEGIPFEPKLTPKEQKKLDNDRIMALIH